MMPQLVGKTVVFGTFGALCLIFAAIAVAPWLVNPLEYLGHREMAAATAEQIQPWEPPNLEAPAFENLAVIVERPIFTATRRPAPQPQPAPTATAADPPDESLILGRYRLTGIVVTPALRMVFVAEPGSRKTIAVERGKELDGWVLSEVERHVIVLESGDRRKQITIGDNADIEISSE